MSITEFFVEENLSGKKETTTKRIFKKTSKVNIIEISKSISKQKIKIKCYQTIMMAPLRSEIKKGKKNSNKSHYNDVFFSDRKDYMEYKKFQNVGSRGSRERRTLSFPGLTMQAVHKIKHPVNLQANESLPDFSEYRSESCKYNNFPNCPL